MFNLPVYHSPDFNKALFTNAPDVTLKAANNAYVPEDFYATTIFPEYFKINGQWILLKESRMDACVIVRDGKPYAVELRNIQQGDLVVCGRTDDGSNGVFVHTDGFVSSDETDNEPATFAFRTGRSRETSASRDYDKLCELLRYEKDHGNILWVMGPACVFDYDSRNAMRALIENGYCNCLFAGNALATHDLEAAYFNTALGQDIYTKQNMYNGHYNHLHTINLVRKSGSVHNFVKEYNIKSGVMSALVDNNVPFVLAGSIRDDGPLPDVIHSVYDSQDAMRSHIRKATTVICLATQLHSIATGNLTPAYHVNNDNDVRPVYFYSVDVSEFAVNKLIDRGSLSVCGFVTNIQDFLVTVARNLELR
ncbi:MAG: hypothetical protein IJO14_12285 [Clostridia bacterium]|nr:hypothetical protein [Clostridia bacterium]